MRSSAIFILAAAGLAVAQTDYHAGSGCGSQIDDIIANCLGTQTAQLQSCPTNDWACMCEQQNNVLTCFNNCPADPRKFAADAQKVSWCNAAKAYPSSSSSSAASSASRASVTGTATSGAALGTVTGTATATASGLAATNSMPGSTPQATESSAAGANVVYPGVVAAVFGLAAWI